MIEAVSTSQASASAYAGGAAPAAGTGFGAALTAKLAEFQATLPGSAILSHHHQIGFGVEKPANQDAGNQISLPGVGPRMSG